MTEEECLRAIEDGDSAYGLLTDALPNIEARFHRIDSALVKLLADVRKKFPDAEYYTASGGFNLMIGKPHREDRNLTSQQQLVALSGAAKIGDGDF